MRSDVTSAEHELENEDFLRRLDADQGEDSELPESSPARPAIVRLLWYHRAFVLQWAFRGFLISIVLAVLTPNRYSATTRIMPPDNQGNSGMAMLAALMGKTSPGLSGLASDVLGAKTTGALFVQALQSRTVEDRLVTRFDLRRVYRQSYMQDARKVLESNTVISEDRKSGMITIVVDDRNRARSAEIAQAYVDELNRIMNDVSTSAARRERIFIEQRLATVKQDLHNAAEEFSQFASHNTTLDLTAQTKATVEAAASLQGQLIAVQSQLEGLEQIYTPSNVRVRSLRARVDELKLKLQQISGQETSSGHGNEPSDMPFPSVRELPLLGVRWAELYQEAKVQETVYELLTQQYELAKIQEAKEIPTVKVLDEAIVPEKKSFPPRLVFVVLGTLLGLLAGSIWVSSAASWNALEADDPVKLFALEIVGVQRAWLSTKRRRLGELFTKRASRVGRPGAQNLQPNTESRVTGEDHTDN